MFGGDTLIFTPLLKYISISEAYSRGEFLNVWSLNTESNKFQFKRGEVVYGGTEFLRCVKINDMRIWVTSDHEFLTKEYGYKSNSQIDENTFLKALKIEDTEDFFSDNKLMSHQVSEGVSSEDCYSIAVEGGEGFIVVTDFKERHHSGIVVRGK